MAMTAVQGPAARKDLTLQEVGREGLVYDREGEVIHILNATALTIWKACDGQKDLDALEATVRGKFSGLEGRDVRSDIENLLKQLEERGLLEGATRSDERPADGPQRRA